MKEPCHETCFEAEVIRRFAVDTRQEEMLREHFRRRIEYFTVELPRQERHRREWRQKYGTDPAPMNDRRYREDDYACRYSGFTCHGAQQIRIREGMILVGEVGLPCLIDGSISQIVTTPHRRRPPHDCSKRRDAQGCPGHDQLVAMEVAP